MMHILMIWYSGFIAFLGLVHSLLVQDVMKEPRESAVDQTVPTEVFKHPDGLYEFAAPKGLFRQISEMKFQGNEVDAEIELDVYQTSLVDEVGIFNKEDLIARCKSGIRVTYFADMRTGCVVSGLDSSGKIVYRRATYDELISMGGRDEGEPGWMWFKYAILEVRYNARHKQYFDSVIPIVSKSFSSDFASW
jgi:hypothetical protein